MKAFIFFVFAVLILIANGEIHSKINYENGEVYSINDIVKNVNENNEPTQNEKIRPKCEMPRHWCGALLNKKIAEVCGTCFDDPSLKIKRSIAGSKPASITVKCCRFGCTLEELKQFCC